MRPTVVALAVLLSGACGTSAPSAGPEPPPPAGTAGPAVPGIEAEAVRLRTDEAIGGQVQVRITDTGAEPFTVTAVALDSPGFAELPATDVTADFAPGRVIDLPAPYGPARCQVDPLPAAAQVTVVRPGAAAEVLRVPLAAEVLTRIHDEECAVRAVTDVVDIAVTGLAEDGDALTGSLTLTRRGGDETVVATRLGRSVLLEARADELPLELAGGEGSAATPVVFTPATCDPHVLSETKKPYVFPLAVLVGDGEPVAVDLPLDEAARALLAALVQRVCASPT
jgi:hypothetical protein